MLGAAIIVAAIVIPAQAAGFVTYSREGGSACDGLMTALGTDVDGGCLTHATSEGTIELRKHIFGIESHITGCNNEFAARFLSDGSGWIFEQALSGASCSRQACRVPNTSNPPILEGDPWKAHGTESFGSGQGTLTTSFCVEPVGGGTDETCEIDVPFRSYSNEHRQEYGQVGEMSSHGMTGFRCELVGHWNSEVGGTHDGQAEQELVVTH
jgi:hypothetical protein